MKIVVAVISLAVLVGLLSGVAVYFLIGDPISAFFFLALAFATVILLWILLDPNTEEEL